MSKHRIVIEDIVNKLMVEDGPFKRDYNSSNLKGEKSVTGDASAQASARAETAIGKIKANLTNMGISPGDVNDLYTIEQLSVMGFGMNFKLRQELRNEFDEDLPPEEKELKEKFVSFDGRAKVNQELSNERDTLVLDLDNGWKISFNPEQLGINLTSTDKTLSGLADGKEYDVLMGGKYDPNQPGDEKPEGDDGEDDTDEISKEQVYKTYGRVLNLVGYNLYEKMGVKETFPIPNGFIENAVAKKDIDKIKKYYTKYKEHIEVGEEEFIENVTNDNFLTIASWMSRNKKSGVGKGLWARIASAFPQFEMSGRDKTITAKPGETGKPVPDKDRYIQDSKISLLNVIMESVNEEKWSKIFGLPLKGTQFELFIKNLGGILTVLSKRYNVTFNKDKVREYMKGFLKESITEAEEDKGTEELFDYVLKLYGITLGYSDSQDPESKKGKKDGKSKATGKLIVKDVPPTSKGWWTNNMLSDVNRLLSSGVEIKKSEQNRKNGIILVWPSGGPKGTDAMVLSGPDDWWNKVHGTGYSGEVTIGKKVGGKEQIDKDFKGQVQLKVG
jgi:hypothetical protein